MKKHSDREDDGKATFVIQIKYRQNATWQGTIQWVEKQETQSFRSALEMLRIIDSTGEPEEDEAGFQSSAKVRSV